jgi:glycosyltransferase involved in cell wall biosynthesis
MAGLVTVVIPCFNYARFLDECVDSLIGQSYSRWECIIVDDGSTDDTLGTCLRLSQVDARVRFLRQVNAGLSAARNAGIRAARGEFLQLLDADDLLEPDKLKVQVEHLEGHPTTDLVVGRAAYFKGRAPYKPRQWLSKVDLAETAGSQDRTILAAFVRENLCPVNAVLTRRSVLDSVGLFDESLRAHEDWDFWLRCGLHGHRFAFVSKGRDRALVRQHDANMSAAKRFLHRSPREAMGRSAIEVRERVHPLLPADLRAENAMHLSEATWTLGLELVRAGRFKEGWTLYREGLRAAPRKSTVVFGLLLLFPGVPTALRLNRWLRRAFT